MPDPETETRSIGELMLLSKKLTDAAHDIQVQMDELRAEIDSTKALAIPRDCKEWRQPEPQSDRFE